MFAVYSSHNSHIHIFLFLTATNEHVHNCEQLTTINRLTILWLELHCRQPWNFSITQTLYSLYKIRHPSKTNFFIANVSCTCTEKWNATENCFWVGGWDKDNKDGLLVSRLKITASHLFFFFFFVQCFKQICYWAHRWLLPSSLRTKSTIQRFISRMRNIKDCVKWIQTFSSKHIK